MVLQIPLWKHPFQHEAANYAKANSIHFFMSQSTLLYSLTHTSKVVCPVLQSLVYVPFGPNMAANGRLFATMIPMLLIYLNQSVERVNKPKDGSSSLFYSVTSWEGTICLSMEYKPTGKDCANTHHFSKSSYHRLKFWYLKGRF